jgi:hypothetical protein
MLQHAEERGANGVIGVRSDANEVAAGDHRGSGIRHGRLDRAGGGGRRARADLNGPGRPRPVARLAASPG